MSQQVIMWKAEDGELFKSLEAADLHEQQEELFNYVDRHAIYGSGDSVIYGYDVKNWLKEHKYIHMILLPEEEGNESKF